MTYFNTIIKVILSIGSGVLPKTYQEIPLPSNALKDEIQNSKSKKYFAMKLKNSMIFMPMKKNHAISMPKIVFNAFQ